MVYATKQIRLQNQIKYTKSHQLNAAITVYNSWKKLKWWKSRTITFDTQM